MMVSNQEESSPRDTVDQWKIDHEDYLAEEQGIPRRATKNLHPKPLKAEKPAPFIPLVEPPEDDFSMHAAVGDESDEKVPEEPADLKHFMEHPEEYTEVERPVSTKAGREAGLAMLGKIVESWREKRRTG